MSGISRQKRPSGVAECASVSKKAAAMLSLSKLLSTMKTKTWSAIPSSAVEEQKYVNTIQQALSTDLTRVTFDDTEALFVDSCILRLYNNNQREYCIDQDALYSFINESNNRSTGTMFEARQCKPSLSDGSRASKQFFFLLRGTPHLL
jgi:hypothetical protein